MVDYGFNSSSFKVGCMKLHIDYSTREWRLRARTKVSFQPTDRRRRWRHCQSFLAIGNQREGGTDNHNSPGGREAEKRDNERGKEGELTLGAGVTHKSRQQAALGSFRGCILI